MAYGLAAIYLYSEIIFKLQSDMNCALDQSKMSMVKETLEKLGRMGVNVKQYMMIQLGEKGEERKKSNGMRMNLFQVPIEQDNGMKHRRGHTVRWPSLRRISLRRIIMKCKMN